MATGGPGAAVPSSNDADNVAIRVIALTHATSQNEDINLVVSLDATVAQLKLRFQQTFAQRPRPETQRLIYQGRPLTDDNAALRQILRLEPERTNSPSAHVIHLVIRDEPSSSFSNAGGPLAGQAVPPSTNAPTPSHGAPILPPNLGVHGQHLAGAQVPQALIQNVLQQHMAMHHQHMHQHHHGPHLSHSPQPIPNMNPNSRNIDMPPTFTQQNQAIGPSSSPSDGTGAAMPTSQTPGAAASAFEFHGQGGVNVRVEETTGLHGERIRRVVQSGPLLSGHMNPVERSASAPGFTPRSGFPSPAVRTPFSPVPPGALQFGVPPMQEIQRRLATVPRSFPVNASAPVLHGPQPQPHNPVLFLVSSPSGPEALLFAPQHGYFSNQQTATPQPQDQPQANTAGANDQPLQPTPTGTVPQTQDEAREANPGQVVLRPQVVAPDQAAAQVAQPARREGEDLLALVLQRGWLFLRLYMFIFVLSEAGTWRRYILLTIASLVCLLPRNNPFTDMFQAARQHFDNLIGPPQPPANVQAQNMQGQQPWTDQNNRNAAPDGATDSQATTEQGRNPAQMPTPEEHARRLLREHEQRNPNMLRDTIYRVEQAVALFLASLVPGVGERHVRAREDARRIVQEEEERRQREETERRQQEAEAEAEAQATETKPDSAQLHQSDLPSSSSTAATDSTAATSTGVDTSSSAAPLATTDDEGMRLRSNDANA